jgi:hypothetical protein
MVKSQTGLDCPIGYSLGLLRLGDLRIFFINNQKIAILVYLKNLR